ncbi:carboxymuconolactone decarboxylase family protein [Janthinobacterium agaricidamnosum]|uniref:Carboxymuconolactone decarboxylase family protein n=1 Tax=Janthinobacterium agaricidamnosum NBRC 102515 = DSM 9628 TaxID=1349767 RepID=W0V4K1_9BURK|nr:carboxymuconolactone decarboxylase family protein [Janthinobacterium agaricidamnosum]CDG82505.1 carboxymuconolactone decarboxylase family protein [Janthinobacterium agaricidamnosum NBRC 102515 = DSM 9628]
MKAQQRLPAFDAGAMSQQQRQVLDDILSGPRGNLDGPFLGWIHSPELAGHAQELGAFCRYRTGLPPKLSELAILVTAAKWRCQAEWHIHYPIAIAAGLDARLAEALRGGAEPAALDHDERLVWTFATELYDSKRVGDATYAALVDRFGLQVAVNLAALLGYYSLVAMTLNVFNMRAEGQQELPFED